MMCSTVQYSTEQKSAAVQFREVKCNSLMCSKYIDRSLVNTIVADGQLIVPYGAIHYNTLQYTTIHYNTLQYTTLH